MVFFIIRDRNIKLGNQKIPRIIGKPGLGVQNGPGHWLTVSSQENTLLMANTLFQITREDYTWTSPEGQTKIRLTIFFAAKDGEALYSQ